MRISKAALTAALLLTAVSAIPSSSKASDLDPKMTKVAAQFSADASAKLPSVNPAAMAVFPFQADEKLLKKHVDVAVAELLTQKLIVQARFRLVERAKLDEVLKEQKLGLSGAIESETAAKVGKLAGARLLVMGSVVQMGKSYQISAKMVDADSSDIISVAIIEVPTQTFDDEASRYLVLVPDVQALSLYLVGAAENGTNTHIAPQHIAATNRTVTHYDKAPLFQSFGVGAKYFPAKNWLVDLTISSSKIETKQNESLAARDNAGYSLPEASLSGLATTLYVLRQIPLSGHFNLYAGAGGNFYDFAVNNNGNNASNGIYTYSGDSKVRVLTPAIKLNLEWRPQPRFGWSIFATYGLSDTKFKILYTSGGQNYDLWAGKFPRLILGENISFYF